MEASCCGGVFSAAGTGAPVRVVGKLNGPKYILNENLVQSAQDLRVGWRFIFQQDNDLRYTAKIMQESLRDTSVNVLEWPSQSPDSNPVEHLCRPENVCPPAVPIPPDKAWEDQQRDEWQKIPKSRCAKLIASYSDDSRRLKTVISAKGASTKYWLKGLNTYVNVIFQVFLSNK